MPRIDLEVPFSEKDEAKQLGARWDASRKVWFVPDGHSSSAFKRWMPENLVLNLLADSYLIAKTTTICWKCDERTRVYGFILPEGHSHLLQNEESDVWHRFDEPTIIHYVTALKPSVAMRINQFTQNYRIDFSKTTQSHYWMNHCESCGMKQGDFELYCEPQGSFYPVDEKAASKIVLRVFNESFACNGSAIYGDGVENCVRFSQKSP